MTNDPTVSISITSIIEIRNSQGDSFVVSPLRVDSHFVKLHRSGSVRRREMAILHREVDGALELKTALEEFLAGDYAVFEDYIPEPQSKKQFALKIAVQFMVVALLLIVLSFIVSVILW